LREGIGMLRLAIPATVKASQWNLWNRLRGGQADDRFFPGWLFDWQGVWINLLRT